MVCHAQLWDVYWLYKSQQIFTKVQVMVLTKFRLFIHRLKYRDGIASFSFCRQTMEVSDEMLSVLIM
jgi:hypothetical protein